MPAKKASISINLLADATRAKAGFAEAEKAAGGLDKQFGNIAKTAVNAFATREIINFGKGAVDAASDLAESANAVSVSFGDAANEILHLGENAAKTVGLSATEFNGFAVQFAGFTRQLTTADKDIVEVTDELTVRIADFASVMNLSVPEAAQKFQSALAGSTEPMRQFGIDVSAAAVQTFALENGITDNAAAMTEAEKVTARYQLIMQETEKMSGDFANTSDGLANSQRILAAELENARATIGEALVPVMQTLMGAITPVIEGFTALPEGMQQFIVLAGVGAVGMRTLSTTMQGFGVSAKNSTRLATGFSGALGALTIGLAFFADKQADIEAATQRLSDVLGNYQGVLTDVAIAEFKLNNLGTQLDKDLQTLGLTFEDLLSAAKGNADALDKFTDATKFYKEPGKDFFNILSTTTVGTEEQMAASQRLTRELEGMTQALKDAAFENERLASAEGVATANASSLKAEMRRFKTLIDDDFVRVFGQDVSEAATGMGELRKQTFKTNTEMDRLFGRVSDEQAIADFLETMEDTAEVMGEAAEGSKEFEQAERDRLFALEDLIEAHSVLDAAFAKELLPLIDMGTAEEFETKIIELLGLIGQIAPNIQAAIDAGSFGMGVIEAGNQPYVQSTLTQDVGARDGLTVMGDLIVQPPVGAEEITVDKIITYSKRNGGVPVANLPGVRY